MHHIPQVSSITGTSPSDCLVSYPGDSWEGVFHSADKQSLYSTAPAYWARNHFSPLQLCENSWTIISLTIFTNPPLGQDMTHGQFFKWSLTGLNSEFSFSWTSCLTKAEEPSLSYYLPIAGGRIIGFIPFTKVLVRCEMQLVSSRIWTHVAVSISYDDNHYTTNTSNNFFNIILAISLV